MLERKNHKVTKLLVSQGQQNYWLHLNVISKDNFVYLGHPESYPDYNVYYDKSEKMYLFIDKDGCFDKNIDGPGTCLALNHKEANNFVENILPKMLDRRSKILEESNKEKIITYLKESNMLLQK